METSPKLRVKVIVGSTREGRFSEKPAKWIADFAQKQSGLEVEAMDLRDFPMPFYDSAKTASQMGGVYPHESVAAFAKKIGEGDAFIFVSPEYNHGIPAVLKNALDWVYAEWNQKPMGVVSWGGVGGARSVEHLRLVSIELQMMPIRNALHMPFDIVMAANQAENPSTVFAKLEHPHAESFVSQLVWWARILKLAREEKK